MKIASLIKASIFFTFILFNLSSEIFANHDALTKIFYSPSNHYSIRYPDSLTCYDRGKGVVIFKGNAGNPPHPLFINIQTIYTKKAGGTYATIKDLMDDFRSQVPLHTQDAKFLERKSISLMDQEGNKLFGEETTLTFREEHQTLKQRQVMIMSHDGNLFQAWAYRAPLKDYDANYPLAAAMLSSWIIT